MTFRRWIWGAVAVSVTGGAIVFAFLAYSAPFVLTPHETQRLLLRSAVVFGVFLITVAPVLLRIRHRRFAVSTHWLHEERGPTDEELRMVLRAPNEAVRLSAIAWAVCAVGFALLAVTETPAASLYILATVILGGTSTTAVGYLIAEWIMRPVSARALRDGPPDRRFGPSIQHRMAMAWTLATGLPLLGVATLEVGGLADDGFRVQRSFAAVLILIAVALGIGLFTILAATRSMAERVGALRGAVARVQDGDFDTRVVVDDASEIGRLQAGFNTMVAGLAARERIRDTLGAYVDHAVADHILRADCVMEAQEVEVTIMFVDVRGFTAFTERLPATEVVATLNRLFERIVPLVHGHGGLVDKYAGDGLMAVFGAPHLHADCALAAAIAIADAVRDEFDGTLSVGVGLDSGTVVAGNLGGGGRLEFSVIGDAVNVAARVESATRQTGDAVLLTGHTLRLLRDSHGDFTARPGLTLKGKTVPVDVYAPSAGVLPG